MPKRTDIQNILIVGSGPIIIGQGCEFDYSGTQACKALREEGYRVVLLNSNPATIMTDPELADRTYIEPITPEFIEKVLENEKQLGRSIDAMLPTLGGQTGLNCAVAVAERGILEAYGVEMIGADRDTIHRAEDRTEFKRAMQRIGADVPRSGVAHTWEEARRIAEDVRLPCVIRPAYTLGGEGGGFAADPDQFETIAKRGLAASPVDEILIEEDLTGWKEFELEVMRDRADNVVIVCSIENVDPMGVHTGDSITVAPAQTLTDKEYQRMRDSAIAIIREIGVETGGSNIQFGVDPKTGRQVVIEMNPRVSRSSALASKATGYPIAKIAAKLAVGYTLDEIPNDITRKTPASFEPTIDYCVVKIPRWTFEKFADADETLTTQMKSVGEAMAIGRTFKEAFQKAIRSMEIKRSGYGLDANDKWLAHRRHAHRQTEEATGDARFIATSTEAPSDTIEAHARAWPIVDGVLRDKLSNPCQGRPYYIRYAFKMGWTVDEVHALTRIDPWFLENMRALVLCEDALLSGEDAARLKSMGYSDVQLSAGPLTHDARPVYKLVDTCAGEFEAETPYYYSSHERSVIHVDAGWPIASAVGDANDDRFESPTAKAMGHPVEAVGDANDDRFESPTAKAMGHPVEAVGDTNDDRFESPTAKAMGHPVEAVGDTNDDRFESPTAKAMGHPVETVGDANDDRFESPTAEAMGHPVMGHPVARLDDEIRVGDKHKVIVLGGGPNRIGQGIEFDYCCCHASFAARESGFESVMVNSNPETVSTDYDTSDKLFFEPLTHEDVFNICERLNGSAPLGDGLLTGVIVQFGGQTPLNLAQGLKDAKVPILGTSPESIHQAEDREAFQQILRELSLLQPPNGIAFNLAEAISVAGDVGYPVLVRPSYVLGGRGMEKCNNEADLTAYMSEAITASDRNYTGRCEHPVLIDKFLLDAIEVDVDAVADFGSPSDHTDRACLVCGVMEHIEEAGIHSGDSTSVLPPYSLGNLVIEEMKRSTRKLAERLRVCGLMNIQFAVLNRTVYVIEVNPRASRTVPFVSKATGVPWPRVATRVMLGEPLRGVLEDYDVHGTPHPAHVSIKAPVFPFTKFPGVDVILGPEMRSTGEVMGIDTSFGKAFAKAQIACGLSLPTEGNVLISVNDPDKPRVVPIARDLSDLGFSIFSTRGTKRVLAQAGIRATLVSKSTETGAPFLKDLILNGALDLLINTPIHTGSACNEGRWRAAATMRRVPLITTLAGARAAVEAIRAMKSPTTTTRPTDALSVRALQDYVAEAGTQADTR